jgi:hypothetical protein
MAKLIATTSTSNTRLKEQVVMSTTHAHTTVAVPLERKHVGSLFLLFEHERISISYLFYNNSGIIRSLFQYIVCTLGLKNP